MNDGADFRPSVMPRRQFLLLGSSALVGAAATSLPAQILSAAFADSTLPLLSVGYFAGTAADLAASGRSRGSLVSAESLRSGDASLESSGLRLRVQQFSRAAERRVEPHTIALNVLYRIDGKDDQKTPFAAWTHSLNASGAHRTSANRFVVPVSASSPLELTVARRAPRVASIAASDFVRDEDFQMTAGPGRSVASFTLGREHGANKLRRGIYVLALRRTASQGTPDWQSIRFIAPAEGSAPVLQRASIFGNEPVSFDYIAISVESA
jgi:hypothetical protein